MLYETKNPHGGDVYGGEPVLDYSANINPLGTPPSVIDALCEAARHVRQYPDPYCRNLVSAIAAHEEIRREWILCGNGAAELIYAWCDALRPKVAAELAPTFCEYSLAAEHHGAQMIRWFLSSESEFKADEGLADFLRTHRPNALFLCTPNNPSGQTINRNLLEQVLDLCAQQHTQVLLDECFLDFTNAPSAKNLLAEYPNLLILKAFTKSYALAGARVGYCLSANTELLMRMANAVQPWNVSLLAQYAAVAALKEGEYLNRAKRIIGEERTYLQRELSRLGMQVFPSEADFMLFRGQAGLDAALKQKRILIRSCANYYGLDNRYYRIAVRLHEENERLIAAIRQTLEEKEWH